MDIWRAGGPKSTFSRLTSIAGDFRRFAQVHPKPATRCSYPRRRRAGRRAKALYAFGRHDAIGFSPFAIDRSGKRRRARRRLDLLSQLAPLILEHQGKGTMSAVRLARTTRLKRSRWGTTRWRPAFGPRGAPGATPPQQTTPSVAIFIPTGPDEYFVAGSGIRSPFLRTHPGLRSPEWARWKKARLSTAAGFPAASSRG